VSTASGTEPSAVARPMVVLRLAGALAPPRLCVGRRCCGGRSRSFVRPACRRLLQDASSRRARGARQPREGIACTLDIVATDDHLRSALAARPLLPVTHIGSHVPGCSVRANSSVGTEEFAAAPLFSRLVAGEEIEGVRDPTRTIVRESSRREGWTAAGRVGSRADWRGRPRRRARTSGRAPQRAALRREAPAAADPPCSAPSSRVLRTSLRSADVEPPQNSRKFAEPAGMNGSVWWLWGRWGRWRARPPRG